MTPKNQRRDRNIFEAEYINKRASYPPGHH